MPRAGPPPGGLDFQTWEIRQPASCYPMSQNRDMGHPDLLVRYGYLPALVFSIGERGIGIGVNPFCPLFGIQKGFLRFPYGVGGDPITEILA